MNILYMKKNISPYIIRDMIFNFMMEFLFFGITSNLLRTFAKGYYDVICVFRFYIFPLFLILTRVNNFF
ncbi:hypothetical protein C2G38_2058838 [Gigaspora rosea]|uniref:Uncharacterized protein n=1 Tax=Gigaspora rosea TaxID=44941 RepID=A0A397W4Z1_9GLOM|nr:hypothetical protein C2G38_2058838 [Gigaspora rosea]